MTVVAVMLGFVDAVQLGPRDDLGYRRPLVTASFEDLRRRGLPEVLFANSGLPEGVTICDVNTFAAMIEEAYNPPVGLLIHEPDEHGNQLLWAVGFHGIGQWAVITPRRSGWRMMLAPERDGQRQVTVEAWTKERDYEEIGPTLATFTISTRLAGKPPAENPVQLDILGYRRPPATVSFDDLSARGLPRVLFVHTRLPEGIAAYDIGVFAAMVEEAYHTPGTLHMHPDLDGHANEQCTGIGSTGTWEWRAVRPGKPIDGVRYASPQDAIYRILLAPEKDGKRACTLDLRGSGAWPEDDSPVTFTIRTRPGPGTPRGGEAAGDLAGAAAAVGVALSGLGGQAPAAAGLLRLLAFLAPGPLPLGLLLAGPRAGGLPGPEAAAVIGPLLGDPAAAGDAVAALRRHALLLPAEGGQEEVHPLARDATRAQLTAQETAHWQQAAAALVEAAVPADPQAPASWSACAVLLPHARAALDLTSDGMARIARYLGESGSCPAARDLCRQIAGARTADDAHGPEHPDTLATRREWARWTGMAGDAARARDQLAALLRVTRRVQGREHPDTLATRRERARWTGEAGEPAFARDQLAALLPITERVMGPDHPRTLTTRSNLAYWTEKAGWPAHMDAPKSGPKMKLS